MNQRAGAGSHLPGLVGLVTSGGAGLVRVGGLGGAASGASDMVDDGGEAMHCGKAASDQRVGKKTKTNPPKKNLPLPSEGSWVRVCGCVCV